MTTTATPSFRRVEHHMSTAVTLAGDGLDHSSADAFFARIAELEDLLSRFRPHSEISRLTRGELTLDEADPSVRNVLLGCEELRTLTGGDFDHEPRRRSGSPGDPALDVSAYAKGWIVEDASTILRMTSAGFAVNAGGDVTCTTRLDGTPWRVGVQHPDDRTAVLGTFELRTGSVATSGAYERGHHIRTGTGRLTSVSVTGPDLAVADGLSTAVYASGDSPPGWWDDVDPRYGLLTLSSTNRLRWIPPRVGHEVEWQFPTPEQP